MLYAVLKVMFCSTLTSTTSTFAGDRIISGSADQVVVVGTDTTREDGMDHVNKPTWTVPKTGASTSSAAVQDKHESEVIAAVLAISVRKVDQSKYIQPNY